MTDEDRFDRDLGERLVASENRVPGGAPPRASSSRLNGRAWAALGAAVVIVTAVVTGIAATRLVPVTGSASPSAGATPSSPMASETVAPTGSPTSSPTPAGPPRPPWTNWQSIPSLSGVTINDVAWTGGRFVAVGGGDGIAVAFSVLPGGDLRPSEPIDPPYIPFQPDDVPGQRFWMTTLAVFRGQLIGLGWMGTGCCDNGIASVWTSSDGTRWEHLDTRGTAFGDTYHFPADVAVLGQELVLLSGTGLGGHGATTWISADGLAWQEHAFADQRMNGMQHLAAGSSRLLGIGGDGNLEDGPRCLERPAQVRYCQALIWTSTDARSWTDGTPPPGAAVVTAIAYDSSSDLFYVGGRAGDELAVWVTPDGARWSDPRVVSSAAEGRIDGIAVADGVVSVVGTTGESTDAQLLAWTFRTDVEGVSEDQMLVGVPVAGQPHIARGGELVLLLASPWDGSATETVAGWRGIVMVP